MLSYFLRKSFILNLISLACFTSFLIFIISQSKIGGTVLRVTDDTPKPTPAIAVLTAPVDISQIYKPAPINHDADAIKIQNAPAKKPEIQQAIIEHNKVDLTKCKIPKYRKKPECKALLKTPLN
jgi:hypothetical protein